MIVEMIGCRYSGIIFGRMEFLLASKGMISLHLDPSMDRSEIEKISKALADETRLRIFEAISATNRMTCGEIVSLRGVTPATVSHHLKILSEAGLIDCRRKGQFVHSQAVPETITAYAQALAKIARGKKAARRRNRATS
jgi:ArsR family transcriptional regulator, arsenate/arsenite/antimonite-responsive transcriptional repressor